MSQLVSASTTQCLIVALTVWCQKKNSQASTKEAVHCGVNDIFLFSLGNFGCCQLPPRWRDWIDMFHVLSCCTSIVACGEKQIYGWQRHGEGRAEQGLSSGGGEREREGRLGQTLAAIESVAFYEQAPCETARLGGHRRDNRVKPWSVAKRCG